jgi:hypothetical protein
MSPDGEHVPARPHIRVRMQCRFGEIADIVGIGDKNENGTQGFEKGICEV